MKQNKIEFVSLFKLIKYAWLKSFFMAIPHSSCINNEYGKYCLDSDIKYSNIYISFTQYVVFSYFTMYDFLKCLRNHVLNFYN